MDEKQKKELMQFINNNQTIPDEYQDILFPSGKKEIAYCP